MTRGKEHTPQKFNFCDSTVEVTLKESRNKKRSKFNCWYHSHCVCSEWLFFQSSKVKLISLYPSSNNIESPKLGIALILYSSLCLTLKLPTQLQLKYYGNFSRGFFVHIVKVILQTHTGEHIGINYGIKTTSSCQISLLCLIWKGFAAVPGRNQIIPLYILNTSLHSKHHITELPLTAGLIHTL